MEIKKFFTNLGKLLLCSIAFILGVIAGGVIVALLGLEPPPMPESVDGELAFLILMLESPLLALVLILIARRLGGGLLTRAVSLSFFSWVVYTLNTTIESLAFTSMTTEGALFTTLSFLPASIFCGIATAWLFPSREKGRGPVELVKSFFSSRSNKAWVWRIAVALVIFIPIYLIIGSLVAPYSAQYFQESMYGLIQPSQEEMLLVLAVRSLLFLLACLPIIMLWQGSRISLFINLGFALFVLVGLIYMLGAYYMPILVRLPHTLEILVDSFAYACVLTILLGNSDSQNVQAMKAHAVVGVDLIEQELR